MARIYTAATPCIMTARSGANWPWGQLCLVLPLFFSLQNAQLFHGDRGRKFLPCRLSDFVRLLSVHMEHIYIYIYIRLLDTNPPVSPFFGGNKQQY